MAEAALKLVNAVLRVNDYSQPMTEMELRSVVRDAKQVIAASGNTKDLAFAFGVMGAAFKRLKKFPEALHNHRQASHYDPSAWDHVNNIGAAHEELEQLEPALDAYEKAAKLSDGHPVPLSNIASVLTKLGRRPEALLVLQRALSKVNDLETGAIFGLAYTCIQMGLDYEGVELLARMLAKRFNRKMGDGSAARFIMEFEQPARDAILSALPPDMLRAVQEQFRFAPFVEEFGPWMAAPDPEPSVIDSEGETAEDVFLEMKESRQRATAAVLEELGDRG